MENAQVKVYSIEVIREDRAIVQIEATDQQSAYAAAEQKVTDGTIEWARQGAVSSNIIGIKNKE